MFRALGASLRGVTSPSPLRSSLWSFLVRGKAGDGGFGSATQRLFHTVPEQPWFALDRLVLNHGSRKKQRILGRGFAGKKLCGRGAKGFYKQAGNSLPASFESGTSLVRRLPKSWKKVKQTKRHFRPINLDKIQLMIDTGRLDPSKKITMKTLIDAGGLEQNFQRFPYGVKLCAKGKEAFRSPVNIELPMSSFEAAKKVLEVGGQMRLVYYTKLGVTVLRKPQKWTKKSMPLPRPAEPTPTWAYFYTERDENGLPYKPVEKPEDVLFVHPKHALYRTLFKTSLREAVAGVKREGQSEFEERLARAEKEWKAARDAEDGNGKEDAAEEEED